MKSPLLERIDLDFAQIEIYKSYVISQIKEGVSFDEKHLIQIYSVFETYFSGRPFVSIADRKFDYTINPNLLTDTKFPNLLGIGVVCYSEASYNTALFEKEFFKGAFEVFYSMKACKTWCTTLLKQYES